MKAKFYRRQEKIFTDHPRFANVKIAVLVTGQDTQAASVCELQIAPATEIPVHVHDPQADSILVMAGEGEAYLNGGWRQIAAGDYMFVPACEEHGIRNPGPAPLELFVHHSPALL